MVKDRSTASQEQQKRVNKSSKRDKLVNEVIFDVKLNKQKLNGGRDSKFASRKKDKGLKPTTKSIAVTEIKLLGHYETDIDGGSLVMDEPGGIRVYCLPVEIKKLQQVSVQVEDSGEEEVVDDWEQLVDQNPSSCTPPPTSPTSQIEVFIPDCNDLNFNLLNGYIPTKDGGNLVGFVGRIRDRTPCMRWMVKNYKKIRCTNGSRLFDIDFMIGNGVIRKVMTSQFDHYAEEVQLAVIFFKGTYFIWDVTNGAKDDELNNKRSFAGLRFEDFTSRGIDGTENEPSNGDKNNYIDAMKYYNVVRFNFGGHEMLVSGEVDCVIPLSAVEGKTPKNHEFIEIKTSGPLESKHHPSQMSHFFRCGKTISWFAQCILLGVKNVVVGIREEEGDEMICRKTHAFTLEELRRHSDGSWSKNRCFDALNKFLYLVKEKVTDDNPEVINVFNLKEGVFTDPVKSSISADENLPDISDIIDIFEKLQQEK